MKSERYRRVDRQTTLVLVVANVGGALLVTLFFQLQAETFEPCSGFPDSAT